MPNDFRLITIPVSHYCEKVRWALDFLGIPFQELAHMPPVHSNATKKYGGIATSTSNLELSFCCWKTMV